MSSPKCPHCSKIQSQKPLKSWEYGKLIVKRDSNGTKWGPSVKCSRYICKCSKAFNFFLTTKGKSWTIPKQKEI